MIEIRIHSYVLNFKRPAMTSRETMLEKHCYILTYGSPLKAVAECNFFKGLSPDQSANYEAVLSQACRKIEALFAVEATLEDARFEELYSDLRDYPSIQFGCEQLWLSFHSSSPFKLFRSPFTENEQGIAINGLVWMGELSFMRLQIDELISGGFRCIKLKIGAATFDQELRLLQELRQNFDANQLEIRVDANGSFTPDQAPRVLETLAALEVHSIEQPIAPRQWDEMARLCEQSPLPIALDEELIGLFSEEQKNACLAHIRPQYLILKPSLIGGYRACDCYIQSGYSWWVTSALESNIGLNAIAQYTATKPLSLRQGLGTGGLFVNNFRSPLEVSDAQLFYRKAVTWELNEKL